MDPLNLFKRASLGFTRFYFKRLRAVSVLMVSLYCTLAPSHAATHTDRSAAPYELKGIWRVIEGNTGQTRAWVQMQQEPDKTYSGYVRKLANLPNIVSVCRNCPMPYTNQPIEGMRIFWRITADNNKIGYFKDGMALDPKSGRVYRGNMHVSMDGHMLLMRGYIGVPLFGRSETWLRETDPAILKAIEQ